MSRWMWIADFLAISRPYHGNGRIFTYCLKSVSSLSRQKVFMKFLKWLVSAVERIYLFMPYLFLGTYSSSGLKLCSFNRSTNHQKLFNSFESDKKEYSKDRYSCTWIVFLWNDLQYGFPCMETKFFFYQFSYTDMNLSIL